jgi:hypothetical protein
LRRWPSAALKTQGCWPLRSCAVSDEALSKRVGAEREARLRKVLEADAEVSENF